MDETLIDQAAALLVSSRRSGISIPSLPIECRPTSVNDANAIARAVIRLLGEPIGGWKVSIKPGAQPAYSPLLLSALLASPARLPTPLFRTRGVEAEISFQLSRDIPPRGYPYERHEIADAVLACPAIEVIETRYTDIGAVSHHETLADNLVSGALVLGQARSDWAEFDFSKTRVTLAAGERTIVQKLGGHPCVDPLLPLVVLANELRNSVGLFRGQIIATGSFTGIFFVESALSVVAEFSSFGQAKLKFAPE